jgi:protein-S-isoprenylcysteine O-methyltransferase Ste14
VLRFFAWMGGAMFVVSLSYCAYFYVVLLGRPVVSDGPAWPVRDAVVDVALFSVFALHHSLAARTGVKRALARLVPATAERTLYVWISSLLLLAVCALWRPLPGAVYEAEGAVWWLLVGVQGLGVALTWRASAVMDSLELAGIRQALGQAPPSRLRIVGPFRFVRHPIYLGWILMVFGAPTMTMSRLVFAAVSSAYLVSAIPWEERSLVEAFGDPYRAYQRQVRWRLLPGIY